MAVSLVWLDAMYSLQLHGILVVLCLIASKKRIHISKKELGGMAAVAVLAPAVVVGTPPACAVQISLEN
jgi:hypothetical protein